MPWQSTTIESQNGSVKLAIVLKALAKINIIKKSVMLGYYLITFSKKGYVL